jgi:translation initiation factor 2 beta subunit (eIF-2beta)/eIF-5
MGRSSDHVFQFMMAELGTEGSIDGNKRLVIRGKFVPKVSAKDPLCKWNESDGCRRAVCHS